MAVREYGVTKDIKAFKFITTNLVPPPKAQVLAHLGIPTAPGIAPSAVTPGELKRRGEIDVSSLLNEWSCNSHCFDLDWVLGWLSNLADLSYFLSSSSMLSLGMLARLPHSSPHLTLY